MANGCVFCLIVAKEENTEILYEDETVIAFSDVKPATKHHYLIIPKTHKDNLKSLAGDDAGMIKHLREVGEIVLQQQGCQSGSDNTRFGYHWPPFNAISHLHLHAIGNTEEMGFLQRGIFKHGTPWFVSHEWLENRIAGMAKK